MLETSAMHSPCPHCRAVFVPARSNQTYCATACQKAATHNSTRGPRNVTDSPEERRRQSDRLKRLQGLSDGFFTTLPMYRPEFMQALIALARRTKELRVWLTKRDALGCRRHHQGTGRLHIAFCLDHYCQQVYGQRSFVMLDPKLELPRDEDMAFPCEYFDPYRAPTFGSGDLQERPCPWSNRAKIVATRSAPMTPRGAYDWRKIAIALEEHRWRLGGVNDAPTDPASTPE